jgi:hypothetical protein
MLRHLFGITAATALIVFCTLLPFLPGPYDSNAAALSLMCQLFGMAGLLLVPVGALCVLSRYWSVLAGKHFGLGMTALVVGSLLLLVVSLGGLASGLVLSVGVFAVGAYAAARMARRLRSLTPAAVHALGLYLLIVPVAVVLLQFTLIGPAIEFSRGRAIRNSAPLIAEIERYHAAHGRYPSSLLSLWNDIWPSVIGIKEFRYEPSGDAYNLVFEQVAWSFGTREFVVYNPRDQQVMTSHLLDLLQLAPQDLDRQRGFYAVHDLPYPHWKYFWFD